MTNVSMYKSAHYHPENSSDADILFIGYENVWGNVCGEYISRALEIELCLKKQLYCHCQQLWSAKVIDGTTCSI